MSQNKSLWWSTLCHKCYRFSLTCIEPRIYLYFFFIIIVLSNNFKFLKLNLKGLIITRADSYSIQVWHMPELSRPETNVSLRGTDFKVHFGWTDLKNANPSLITNNRAVGISGEATKWDLLGIKHTQYIKYVHILMCCSILLSRWSWLKYADSLGCAWFTHLSSLNNYPWKTQVVVFLDSLTQTIGRVCRSCQGATDARQHIWPTCVLYGPITQYHPQSD